ncbi:hypothetical protein IE53DRAFT_363289 [Violaceomyces palustris]|uniref:Uncharacterized protein n=1 Tax=Violaceomyces palustris TaxID=1673888 RepID=A0ACD0NU30_9BASI|nr:hypothetical protein IE53DRAFT_363289 [Violaceomyces palustris]
MDASQVCEAIISFIESPKPLSPEAKPIRAIVLDPFLTRKLNAMHARDLIEKAERGSVWVAMMTRWGNSSTRSDEEALSTAKTLADECAKGLAENRLSCPRFDWDESMAVIEALDEARSAETNHAPLSTRVVASVADTAQTHGAKPSPRLGVLDDLPEVDPEGPSSETQSADEDASGQSLRAQLQEMRHILRQKNALIAVLEQQGRNSSSAGLTGGESRVAGTTLAKNSRSSLPAFGLGLSTSVASSGNNPYADKEGSLSPPISSVNQFESGLNSVTGLKTVKESNRNMALASSAEGFLSPTIASESRRVATLTQQANGVLAVTNISPNHNGGNGGPHSPNGAGQGSGTSRVIHQLTTELQETRQSLEATKSLLRTSQRSCSALQRQLEETKESLSRSRLENDTNSQMMARKERQASEALERARKAEAEVKELGRSSRVWGTRVREVEEQLGEERRLKGKAEAQYEALASSWKTTRESFVKDVEGLRDDVRLKNEENLRNANRLLEVKREMEEAFSVKEGEKERLKEVLEGLEAQKIAIEKFIQGSVGQLVERLEKYERLGQEQQEEVSGVSSELKRILRLMRSGEVSSSSVVG